MNASSALTTQAWPDDGASTIMAGGHWGLGARKWNGRKWVLGGQR